jgi:uncharacterized protein (DUF1810 family)
MSAETHDLQRFLDAQTPVIETALAELRSGRKRTHWMWFVFPQIAGLGFSAMAQRYAIGSRDEAAAYLKHPILGARLLTCVAAALASGERNPHALFGSPDDLKFRSSLTLFAAVAPEEPIFAEALAAFFAGARDSATLERLA